MNREEIEKLLGGYATGTLTSEEQQALFEAALGDQELFDELAHEQSLRDLLSDPAARAQLLASLDERPARWYGRWWRPLTVAAAMAGVSLVAIYVTRRSAPAGQPATVAEVRPPAPVVRAPEAPAPAPPEPQPEPKSEARKTARPTTALSVAPAPRPAGGGGNATGSLSGVPATGIAAGAKAAGSDAAAPQFGAQLGAQSMRMARPAQEAAAPAAAHFGLRYSILRQAPGDEFAEADPGQLQAGDTIRLRFEAADPGYLTIVDSAGSQVVASARLEAAQRFDTPPWKAGQPGRQDFLVRFSRDPGSPASQQATFTITLNFR